MFFKVYYEVWIRKWRSLKHIFLNLKKYVAINDYYLIVSKFWNSQASLVQEISLVAGIPTDDSSNWQEKKK